MPHIQKSIIDWIYKKSSLLHDFSDFIEVYDFQMFLLLNRWVIIVWFSCNFPVTNRGWLLFEGGFYYFGPILDGVIHKNCSAEGWFSKTALRVIETWSSKKLPCCSKNCLLSPNKQARSTCDRDHTHLIESRMRAATISFAELQVWLLFEGGYYSRCGFYSNKYGIWAYQL